MFLVSKPTESTIQAVLKQQRTEEFSYSPVGATQGVLPNGYSVLRGVVELGSSERVFEAAIEAVRRWQMFSVPGVSLYPMNVPIETGGLVAIVIRHFGFWSLNCCRIVYVIDDQVGPVCRFGFAYGTLPEHAESGEERFLVEWNRESNRVDYGILSFSRAGSIPTYAAYPLARWLQHQFVRNSLLAMVAGSKTRISPISDLRSAT